MFVEYLKVMGHKGVAELFRGEDADYESMIELKKQLQDLIEVTPTKFVLPDDAFVFFTHHGDDYRYFLTDNNDDDPVIFTYNLGDDNARIATDKYSKYLNAILQIFRKQKNYWKR